MFYSYKVQTMTAVNKCSVKLHDLNYSDLNYQKV